MLSVIEAGILNDFFYRKPDDDESDDHLEWLLFKKFIKSETDLMITSSNDLDPHISKMMTDGRGETIIEPSDKPLNLVKGKIKYKCRPETFFCLYDLSEDEIRDIRQQNGYLIGSRSDYYKQWRALKLKHTRKIHPVTNSEPVGLKSWNDLNDFLLPFTDLIICDAYVLAKANLIEHNLIRLLEVLDRMNPVKYNFLLVSFEGRDKKRLLDIDVEYTRLLTFIEEKKLKCDIGLILTPVGINKKHDRNIFMNYLRLNSGGSLNYFRSDGSINIETEISVLSSANPDEAYSTDVILRSLSRLVIKARAGKISSRGNLNNNLLHGKY